MVKQMTKKEWLSEMVFRDTFGRPYNLSDVPMTMMTRKESCLLYTSDAADE